MAEWPINLSVAAERLGIAKSTTSTIVLSNGIPTRKLGQQKLIDEAGFALLERAARALPGKSYNRRREPTPA